MQKYLWALAPLAITLLNQSPEQARQKSGDCISAKCHVGIEEMHASPAVKQIGRAHV